MIEAEMYGMMPEREDRQPPRLPPENRSTRPSSVPCTWSKNCGQRLAVDARRRDVGAEPVDDEQDRA